MRIIITNKKRGGAGEYVGRPGVLGNPFPLEREEEREKVIAQFARWLDERLAARDGGVRAELNRLYRLLAGRGELELTCWCSPEPCHAEVIARELAEAARARGREVEVAYG